VGMEESIIVIGNGIGNEKALFVVVREEIEIEIEIGKRVVEMECDKTCNNNALNE
jgi:hypothetical protein